MAATAQHSEERETEATAIEDELAQVCGALNATTARLVSLVGKALETEAFEGTGI